MARYEVILHSASGIEKTVFVDAISQEKASTKALRIVRKQLRSPFENYNWRVYRALEI